MLVKFWDLETQHCFQTNISHKSEINSMIVIKDESHFITGSQDNQLRIFEITFDTCQKENNESTSNNKKSKINGNCNSQILVKTFYDSLFQCSYKGSLIRESKNSSFQISKDQTSSFFTSHSNNECHVELFKILNNEEISKRLSKIIKKKKKNLNENEEFQISRIKIQDEYKKICSIKTNYSVKYVALNLHEKVDKENELIKKYLDDELSKNKSELKTNSFNVCVLACSLQSNSINTYKIIMNNKFDCLVEPFLENSIDTASHLTDVRTLKFNIDSTRFLSGSAESLKVWNRNSLKPIRHFKCDYALCSIFLNDNDHILVGTKVILKRFIL
jgi:U3 small nucleolar RNA-associated protein 12